MVSGTAQLNFDAKDGYTALGGLYQCDPLRVLFPHCAIDEPMTGVLVTTSGGLVGGDHLNVDIAAEAGAAARVMAQAAEKVYRSTGADSVIDIRLRVGPGGWLEWLPQETILFEAARLRRATIAEVAPNARLLAGEMAVFGRTAMGERVTAGLLRDAWDIYRDGRLVWADALHIDEEFEAAFAAPSALDGATACASLVYVGDDAPDRLALARDLLAELSGDASLRAAASRIGDILVVRWLGSDALVLRNAYGEFWATFRNRLAGYPAIMPRLWCM